MLGKNETKSVENNKGDLREIENPGASGAFDDARETTSADSSPTGGG